MEKSTTNLIVLQVCYSVVLSKQERMLFSYILNISSTNRLIAQIFTYHIICISNKKKKDTSQPTEELNRECINNKQLTNEHSFIQNTG